MSLQRAIHFLMHFKICLLLSLPLPHSCRRRCRCIATTFSFLDILICNITTHAVTWKRRYYVHIVRDATTFSHLYNVTAQKEVWLCTLVRSLAFAIREYNFSMYTHNNKYSECECECAMSGDKREKSENADEKRNQIFFSLFFFLHCRLPQMRVHEIVPAPKKKYKIHPVPRFIPLEYIRTLGATSEAVSPCVRCHKESSPLVRHIKIMHFKMDHVCVYNMKGDKFFCFERRVFTSKTKKLEGKEFILFIFWTWTVSWYKRVW